MTAVAEQTYAPGSRVRIRGEEWAVQKCLALPLGGHALHVQGVSDLVRYHQAIFLTPLEKEIVPVRPEDTKLVVDGSPEYRQTKLYLETLLRRTPPTHDRIAIGHRGALDVMPYQLVPANKSLGQLRPRILIADGTGLGKTVEIGIVLSELIKRGRARRILVVAIRSMLAQLQRELWARFTLPLVRLDSEGLTRVQAKIPANRNPFSYFDRVIVSMDTLKNHGLYRAWLEEIRWDVIVVDECHNVANQGSQRGDLARLLASQCDALVLTSATPHNGRAESFANLMRMLDPTSIANAKSFTKEDIAHLYVRRFKKDVEGEAGKQLRDRVVETHVASASPAEESALAALHALRLSAFGRKRVREDALVRWTLIKAYLSSPHACLESIENRIANTRKAALPSTDGPHPNALRLERDIVTLEALRPVVEAAAAGFGKLRMFFDRLRAIGFDGTARSPRVVVFSERIRTLEVLEEALRSELKMKDAAIGVFTADPGNDVKQRTLVEAFGHADSPLRVLLCSDAASEGVNLHHQCHDLFHFDVPWSLIRLTQRNGRIDRFGQQAAPRLGYLVTHTATRTADQHVVDRLIQKEKEVERQLGDAGALLGLYDAEREEEFLVRGVAKGRDPRQLLPDAPLQVGVAEGELGDEDEPTEADDARPEQPFDEPEIDLLKLFAEVQREQAATPGLERLVDEGQTLFADDYSLLVSALRHLEKDPVVGEEPLKWTAHDADQAVTIEPPEPFRRHREPFLPREGIPARGKPYQLVMGREVIASKLRAALDGEGRWPEWHLLWEQHPLVEWLLDALGSAYARGQAPVIVAPSVGRGASVFLMQGMLFNHESEAVDARFLGIAAQGEKLQESSLDLEGVIERVGLRDTLVNRGEPSKRMAPLQALVPSVVEEARGRVLRMRQQQVRDDLLKRARHEQRRLEAWVARSIAEIDKRRDKWESSSGKLPKHLHARIASERRHVEQVKQNHEQLLRSLQSAGAPYVRLVAVFAGE